MSENFSDDLQEKPKSNPREMEEGKPPLNISLFELFRDAFSNRLTPLRATKVTLVDISHSLEELVIADRLPAMVFTGFQESSYWRKEADRYLKMAGIAHSISIFAGGMPPEAPGSNYLHVRLSYNDTLRQEWFLLILTHHFSVLLCGRDRLEDFRIWRYSWRGLSNTTDRNAIRR
jgi:DICT domain-containing protein